jgi:uncharacterized cupredoxin-like copper-binding protein
MPHRLIAISAAAVVAVGVTGCGGNSAGKAADNAGKVADSAKEKASEAVVKVTGGRVLVAMSDYKFLPSTITVAAGTLKVTAKNVGQQPHEFVLLRTDKAPNAVALKGGKASESSSVGEISEQTPGKSATHTFQLKPGNYVFVCNVDGHYKLGMRGSLDVK